MLGTQPSAAQAPADFGFMLNAHDKSLKNMSILNIEEMAMQRVHLTGATRRDYCKAHTIKDSEETLVHDAEYRPQ